MRLFEQQAFALAVLGQIDNARAHAGARVGPLLRRSVQTDFACALAKAEQRLEQFGPTRANQARKAEDLSRPDAETGVLGEARSGEMRHFESGFACRRGGTRRIEGKKIAPDHQARHVDRLEFARRPGRHPLAVAQHRHDVGDGFDLFEPMRNVENRHALRLELANELQELGRLNGRQRSGRLVEDGDPVRDRQGPGDLRELALRDGEPRDGFRHWRGDPEDTHRLDRSAVHFLVVQGQPPPDFAAQKHVLGDREIRRQHDLLMNQHDPAPFRVDRPLQFDWRAVERHRAARGREMAAEYLHQGGFAGAIFADDRMHLAGSHAERDVAQDLDRPVGARQADCFENGPGRAPGAFRSDRAGLRQA